MQDNKSVKVAKAICLKKVKDILGGKVYENCPCSIKGSCKKTEEEMENEKYWSYDGYSEKNSSNSYDSDDLDDSEDEAIRPLFDSDDSAEYIEKKPKKPYGPQNKPKKPKIDSDSEYGLDDLYKEEKKDKEEGGSTALVKPEYEYGYKPKKPDSSLVEIKEEKVTMEKYFLHMVRSFDEMIVRLDERKKKQVGNFLIQNLKQKLIDLSKVKISDENYLLVTDALKLMAWFTYFFANQKNLSNLLNLGDNYVQGNISKEEMIALVDKNVKEEDNELINVIKSGLMIAAS